LERDEYAAMFRLEDDYWWYQGLRQITFHFLDKFISQQKLQQPGSGAKILDAGCGTGKLLEEWSQTGKIMRGYRAFGFEFSEYAFPFLKMRGLRKLVQASICQLPFRSLSFQALICLDVLYHTGVDSDRQALIEIHRVLEPGGLVIINLPAFEFLRSSHDFAVHTRRRYRLKEVRQKLHECGFSIKVLTYRNTLLFPLAAAVRLIRRAAIFGAGRGSQQRGKGCKKSDLRPLPSSINQLLYGILAFENALLARGLTFPFGLSVFCVAVKDGDKEGKRK